MTTEEIFSHLSAHMVKGLMIHDQLASAYDFLNLPGYMKCHEYHYFEESCNYRLLQNYYLEHFHKLIPEERIENPDTIPSNWYKYSRPEIDANTKRAAIKDLMKKWVDWEKDTKVLLETSYKELYELGEIGAALKIAAYIKDNSKELAHAQAKQMCLENINYDIGAILAEQEALRDKYWHKMKLIFEDDD